LQHRRDHSNSIYTHGGNQLHHRTDQRGERDLHSVLDCGLKAQFTALFLALLASFALAQQIPSRQAGVYLATAYNYDIDSSFYSAFGPYTFTRTACTNAVSLGTRAFDPFNVNASVTLTDSNPSNTETVAFVSQTLNGGLCILQLAVTHPHVSYHLTSGTFGLQEAINDATQNGGGNIVLDSRWHGTTAMITGAAGSAIVSITDNRTGSASYTWSGSSYVLVNTGGSLPTGVAAGSICVSNGVNLPCAYQPKLTLDARDIGVDCTGVTDSQPVLQAFVNSMPVNTVITYPATCKVTIGSTINVPSNSGFAMRSVVRAQNGAGNGPRPQMIWTGTSGGMWNLIQQQGPTIEGFAFSNPSNSIAYYIQFSTGTGSYISTEAMVRYNTFTNSINNANFQAIALATTANGEKDVITDNDFFCSQTSASRINVATGDGVLTSGSPTLTCASCTFTTQASPGQRIRVSYAPVPLVDGGVVDTTILSITNDHTLTMNANATSNQTGARIHVGGALGEGIHVGDVNAKHNTLERDSFTQCACGLNLRTGSASASHFGGNANDVLVCVNDISEPTELSYMEDENALRDVETEGPLDSMLTLNHIRNSLSNNSLLNGSIYFGNGGRALITNSIIQLTSGAANSVLIGKGTTAFYLTSIANQWNFTMSAMGFNAWRTEVENSSLTNEVLTSCGDIGIPDAPGACFQFGEGGAALTEGHLVVGSPRNGNTASFNTYTAETQPSNTSFVNEAVGFKSNFSGSPSGNNNSSFFLNLSTSMKMIGFDAAQPWQIRGGNAAGFRFTVPTVQPGTTAMPFARGLWVAAPSANTLITEADGVYVEDLSTHTGITNKFAFKSLGASDTMSVAGPITTASQFTSTLATGTAPFSIASTTPVANLTVSNHPTLVDCGTTSTCSAARKTAALIVRGSVAFPTATTVTVTSLPFTSSSSYSCTAGDQTNPAGVINATIYTSGSSVTFTETNGGNTDTIRYICVGF
jgi:hypothetical protein